MKSIVVGALLAAALAGCVGQSPGGSEPVSPTASPSGAASPAGATPAAQAAATGAGGQAPGPVVLYLQGDMSLALEPAEQAAVALAMPVNGPTAEEYPTWEGTLPRALNVTGAGVGVTFFVRAPHGAARGSLLPVFADLPGFFVELAVGELGLGGQGDGPDVLPPGQVVEVSTVVAGEVGLVPAGARVTLTLSPIYTHVQGAAPFEFVMGPDQPARLEAA